MRSTVCHDVSSSVDGVAEESLSKIHLSPVIGVLTTKYGALLLFSPKGCDIDGIPLGGGTGSVPQAPLRKAFESQRKNTEMLR